MTGLIPPAAPRYPGATTATDPPPPTAETSAPPPRPALRELAGEALRAAENGSGAVVGRVVSFQGFGGRRAGEAVLARPDGSLSGRLLGGAGSIPPGELVGPVRLLDLPVGDEAAVAAGLACGGVATVLVTATDAVPAAAWRALADGMAVAMATLEGASGGVVALVADRATGSLVRHGRLADPAADELAEQAARDALRGGREVSMVRATGSSALVVEVYLPTTTLVVIGEGELAEALVAQGALLGWSVEVDAAYGERARALVSRLGPSDALVVLSHDHDLATPALADALGRGCYVGALGSRHTQAARRERLARAGLPAGDLDRVRGPAGLDLGSRTPEETAVAIVAEVLAARSGRSGASLQATSGPING